MCVGLVGCAIPDQVAKNCGGDLEQGCKMVFGSPQDDDLQAQANEQASLLAAETARANQLAAETQSLLNQIAIERERNNRQDILLEDLNNRLLIAEVSIEGVQTSLVSVQNDLLALYTITAAQGFTNSTQAAQIALLQSQQASMQSQILALQTQGVSAQAAITTLQTQDSVVDYLDCGGDGSGFDEVVLRTRSGKLVAYFESGGNRFLSVLTPGNYQTTDAQHCPFTVTNSGQFCDVLSCR